MIFVLPIFHMRSWQGLKLQNVKLKADSFILAHNL